MNSKTIPSELTIPIEGASALAQECWRLGRIAESLKDSNEGAGIRHASRIIAKTLAGIGIEAVDFSGRAYDSGMVPEVIEVREDDGVSDGQVIVDETIAPTVIWNGQVIKTGQIVVKRSLPGPHEYPKAVE